MKNDTLGVLVATLAGRMPPVGTQVRHPSGFEFEVVEADPRRITAARQFNPAPGDACAGRAIDPGGSTGGGQVSPSCAGPCDGGLAAVSSVAVDPACL